jgi:CubicO group peptidase (beta-lactamase class C family)
MKVQYSISLLVSLFLCFLTDISAQEIYFPEVGSDDWETIGQQELGWCQKNVDELISLNQEGNSKALIILKGGKIALEEYFGDHDATKNWYWASAGKSLTASLVGIAQKEGLVDINNLTSDYLGNWTACEDANSNVTVRHQLTMTTGLDYNYDVDCTDIDCLDCLNEVGAEWFYHNAPYTLLENVIENATGETYLSYTKNTIGNKIGMNGFWLPIGDNNIYFSTARSMARFGLMMQANGDWNGEEIIKDKDYYNSMITPSQEINKSYGYLWWLNGQESYRLPGTTITFPGPILPQASDDTYLAIGKNGQYIIVIPSEDVVIIRMGDNPDEGLVPLNFLIEIIDSYNNLSCTNDINDVESSLEQIEIINKICLNRLRVSGLQKSAAYSISNYSGVEVQNGMVNNKEIDVSRLSRNLYFITFFEGADLVTRRFYKR